MEDSFEERSVFLKGCYAGNLLWWLTFLWGKEENTNNPVSSILGADMTDFKNSGFMFAIGGCVALFVIAQSVFFLRKAIERGRELGISSETVRKTIRFSAIFSVLPSVSILLGLITLSYALGLSLPWIRLSVLGAVTYELPAATAAMNALGSSITEPISSAHALSAVAWVMTIGCISPLIIIPLFLKRIQRGVLSIQQKDNRWGAIFMSALFLGMISAFLGMGISGGLLSILVLLSSATIMMACGILIKKCGLSWLEDFALPTSMLASMALAVLYARLLPESVLPINLFK